jgi:predicted site-specific integrase-resolvase
MFTLEDILGIGNVPAYLTVRQVAEILQVDISTARRKCDEGKIKGAFKLDDSSKSNPPWRVRSRLFEKQLREAEERGELVG